MKNPSTSPDILFLLIIHQRKLNNYLAHRLSSSYLANETSCENSKACILGRVYVIGMEYEETDLHFFRGIQPFINISVIENKVRFTQNQELNS